MNKVCPILHRSMAYLITILVLFIGIKLFFDKKFIILKSYYFVLIFNMSGYIRILTLVSGINIYLASLHQITSVILVFSVLNLNHKMT